MSKKVLFITCDRVKTQYGIISGLFNSARFVVDYLLEKQYDVQQVSVFDGNGVDKVVTEFNPDIVIIEALWLSPLKFNELLKIQRHKNRRWIVRIHSKAPFLANEGMATKWISEYTYIQGIEIAPNTQELTNQLAIAFPKGKFLHLPNIYVFDEFIKSAVVKDSNIIDVGCFGAVRPMKNTYHQALAAIDFAQKQDKKLRFHVNSTRIEQSGESAVKNLKALFEGSDKHELVEHLWYSHTDLLTVISSMDIGTQASFSESFNIVTADFVTAGVPTVASDDIKWMPGILKCKPTSHAELVLTMTVAYKHKKLMAFIQKLYLKFYNYKAKITWIRTL